MGHQGALGTSRGVGAVLGCQGVYWGLAGTLGTQGPERVYCASGALGAPRGCGGLFWWCQGCIWVASGLGA